MTPSSTTDDVMSRPLPEAHRLNYYAVLGVVEGALLLLGYSRAEAQRTAVEQLARCKPDRARTRR